MAEIDELTLAGAKRGDRRALEALIVCYQARVYALVGRLLTNHEGAVDDVAQDVFVKVVQQVGRFNMEGRAALSTWILTIATRSCIDLLRRVRVQARRAEPVCSAGRQGAGGWERVAGELSDPEAQAVLRQRRRQVEQAMRSLPDDQRVVLVLRAYCDLEYAEIASILGVEEGTIKSRLSRARSALSSIDARREGEDHE